MTLIMTILLAGTAIATIEKETSPKKTQNEVRPGDSLVNPEQSSNQRLTPKEESKPKNPQGYDNFVDKNNNGIDDRAEKKQDAGKNILKHNTQKTDKPGIQKTKAGPTRRTSSSGDSLVKKKSR